MEFKIGDTVRFLNDAGEGKIVGFPSLDIALVEDESGFAYEHPLSELVPVSNKRYENLKYSSSNPETIDLLARDLDKDAAKKAERDFREFYKNRSLEPEKKKVDWIEVDLHIHELVDREQGMSNSEMVAIQLEHFERMLRNAETKKQQRIVFIHGVGQGVLRAEIRKLLKDFYPHCEFLDAPYHIYGFGATEVRIHSMRR
jgi:DNA-nicking Smr family endonuclease